METRSIEDTNLIFLYQLYITAQLFTFDILKWVGNKMRCKSNIEQIPISNLTVE